jgi:hypothetical protein
VTGVDVIAAALAAGATAGVTGVATSAIEDAYRGLRDRLLGRLAGRAGAAECLAQEQTDARVWAADLGPDLVQVGADRDEQILAVATLLLELASSSAANAGDDRLRVEHNYGAAAVTMTGPITINNSREALPPARPEAT